MNTALIALDYIIDIMHPSGAIARSAAHAASRGIIEKANHALATAREKNWLIVLVKIGFSPLYQEQPKRSPVFGRVHEHQALALGQRGTEFHPGLAVSPTDLVIIKPRISAFYSSGLEAALRARQIERVVLAGVSSTWAVQATARDAHDRDYAVTIVEDACAAGSEDEHQASMKVLSSIASIVSAAELAQS